MARLKEIHIQALVVTIVASAVSCQVTPSSGLCEASLDCKSCISAHPDCAWCSATSLPEGTPRCFLPSSNSIKCTEYLINLQSKVYVTENSNFTDTENETTGTVIQMRPQKVTVKLRKGQTTKVNITFKKVIDYPLDLYYVMDLSNSMADDLKTLKNLGAGLLTSIREEVTENVQVGFGSFVDKVLMPFTGTIARQLQNPCAGGSIVEKCAPPFGFHHQLAITGNATAFQAAVKGSRVSGNIDFPEGAFDALMQIAVCEDFIKWRLGSMRVILLTTDAAPHIAMDGKLAAILEANDMKCHLKAGFNSNYGDEVFYAKSKTLDYPSLGQIKEAFTEHRIRSIFAVTKEVLPLYKELPKVLNELATVAELANDSTNIIPLIQTSYDEIRGRLVVRATDAPSHVTLSIRTYCQNGEINDEAMDCDKITKGDEIVFELSFTANQCLHQKDQIRLTSSSLTDVVTIDLEYICDCDCQEYDDVFNSSHCNSHGNVTCGLCNCDEGYEGSKCQCESAGPGEKQLIELCRKNSSTKGECEGQGQCDCGVCICNDGFKGKYCECRTTGCPTRNQQLCGGNENGVCNNCPNTAKEDQCECINGYANAPDGTCSCHSKACKAERSGEICTGHGYCDCEKCVCNDALKWSGRFCQNCIHPDCSNILSSCEDVIVKECARCRSKYGNEECKVVCTHPFLLVNTRDSLPTCDCPPGSRTTECKDCATHDSNVSIPGPCVHHFDDLCSYSYKMFWTNEYRFYVYVKSYDRDTDCPKPVEPIVIVLPSVGTVVLIGLISLLLWKIYTKRRDRLAYEELKREEETFNSHSVHNKMFVSAVSTYSNPMCEAMSE